MIALSMGEGKVFMRRVCNLVATLPLRNVVNFTYIRYDTHTSLQLLVKKLPKPDARYQEITTVWSRTWRSDVGRLSWVTDRRGLGPKSMFSFARAILG